MNQEHNPFATAPILGIGPATESQKEIWASAQMGDDGNCAFNESLCITLTGELHAEILHQAIANIVQQNDALRIVFDRDGTTLCYLETIPLANSTVDFSNLLPDEIEAKVAAARLYEVETPFDLVNGPLFRYQLIKAAPTQHFLLLSAHHAVCDGWSLAVILKQLGEVYSALVSGASSVQKVAHNYRDYASLDEQQSKGENFTSSLSYWLNVFREPPTPLELPTDHPRPPVRTYQSKRFDYSLPPALVQSLRREATNRQCSFFTLLYATFQILVHRVTRQSDLVVGIPVAGQLVFEQPDLVGHCVNMLPIRTSVIGDSTVGEHIKHVQQRLFDAYEHPHCTFGTLIQHLHWPHDPSRIPLAPILFNVDEAVAGNSATFTGLHIEVKSNPRSFENFELFVNASANENKLILECQYNVDLFDEATIAHWMDCYETLLSSLLSAGDTLVATISVLSKPAQEKILVEWNATKTEVPGLSIVDRFAAQAAAKPDLSAIEYDGEVVTYSQLDSQSSAIAHAMLEKGVKPGDFVGIYLPRTPLLVAALLATWKIGAAYVPLDPAFPPDRLQFMLTDAEAAVVLTSGELIDDLAGLVSATTIDVESIDTNSHNSLCALPTDPHRVAYLMYTSGSTGKPKGVLVPQSAVENFIFSMAQTPGMQPSDRMVAITTIAFDISVLELFLPLTVGATIVLCDSETASDGYALKEFLDRANPTHFQATPSTYQMLLDADWPGGENLKLLIGGEKLSPEMRDQLLNKGSEVWNMYGPTETTVWSTCHRCNSTDQQIVVGRPIANTQIYVLDDKHQPTPIGTTGDIYIAGAGVTLGYHHRPDLTASAFVTNPFHDPFANWANPRLYRTGDIGRWRSDGTLAVLGRTDHQVKLRGFRIELGEIETAILKHQHVQHAVVTVSEVRPGDSRLIAYIVSLSPGVVNSTTIRRHLRPILPVYMIPQHIVELDRLPLTPNNKIDRRALPNPLASASNIDRESIPPRTNTEKQLAEIWSAVLGHKRISIYDRFFEIGGHSLSSLQMIGRVQDAVGVRLLPRYVLLETLEHLAKRLEVVNA